MLEAQLASRDVPWTNCLALGCDNALVMTGTNKGVIAFVRKERPNVFMAGCCLHLVHIAAEKKKKKKKKLYSTPNRQMYKLQYLTYQIYNLSNYVRTYIDIMCINIHRRYKKMININNVLWGR